ncbi:MAG: ATP-binding protein, partial [Myxococcota bacterium]
MSPAPFKHNPAFLEPDALVARFVVREAELEALLETLRENVGVASNQHVLVVGPRGMGKTTLLHRVAIAVQRDPALERSWRAIRFAEEAYSVSSVGELWLEALLHLANDTGDKRWRDAHTALLAERDEKRLQTLALARLMDYADDQGRRLVLIVENLQMLLDDQQIDREEAWALRHALQTEPRLMMLASATSRLDALSDTKQAMYDLFKVIDLQPLDDDATRTLWANVAGHELAGERIRPIRILTGGNPRMVVIMAAFAAGRSFRQLMADLLSLVDEHTTYFKANVEELPIQERKVFVHLADLWKPSTARDIAARARMEVSLVSANLKRLVHRGLVTDLEPGARVRLYQVAERMYNIYHLLRSRTGARDQVQALVEFMVHFYDPSELATVADGIVREVCGLGPGERKFHFAALDGILRKLTRERRKAVLESAPAEFFALPDRPRGGVDQAEVRP